MHTLPNNWRPLHEPEVHPLEDSFGFCFLLTIINTFELAPMDDYANFQPHQNTVDKFFVNVGILLYVCFFLRVPLKIL